MDLVTLITTLDTYYKRDTEHYKQYSTDTITYKGTKKDFNLTMIDNQENTFLYNEYVTVTINDNKTTVTNNNTGDGRRYSYINQHTNTVYSFNENITVEFTIITGSNGNVRIQLLESNNNYASQTLTQLGATNGANIKITYDGTNVNYYVDNTLTYTVERTFTNYAVSFYIPDNTNFTYTDFKIITPTIKDVTSINLYNNDNRIRIRLNNQEYPLNSINLTIGT